MVVAENPLWVVHSTAAGGVDGILSKHANSASTDDGTANRASESLSLLESVGGCAKKAAIYSIDVHPDGTKFATGGGDGAVRLWNASQLFAKHRGNFRDGAYQSSGAESLSEGAASSGGEDNNSASDATPEEQVHDLNQLVRRKKDGSTPVNKPPNGVAPLVPSPQRTKKDSKHHRLLCSLSAHTGSSVLCVRFSTSGQYLASSGDDAVVCVYALSTATTSLDQQHHAEHWTRIKLCRGHTLDVVGLAWAPDDSHLVSCSLDSDAPIIVWKLTDLAERRSHSAANVLCNPYKILGKNIHTSTVKGVTFDPAGTYLASSGDDPAVCIWRAHDDWGLEKRIDDGIFRKWKEDNVQELSSQTLFRRLSWSTDGTYICSTNATVKNKHVASTISREGWSVSNNKSATAGAANLVGHKQPVVVSRHCPRLLDACKAGDEEDEDDEPDYATLVALGDKRGFVTVWSTRKSRPVFKLQCSESRCTVTDLAWGQVSKGNDMILLVSLLDGNVVALRFGVPSELGAVLSDEKQKRVFQLRYGLDLDDDIGIGRRRLFVGDNSGPKLIENVLQLTLEEQENQLEDNDEPAGHATSSDDDVPMNQHSPKTVKYLQTESRVKGGKKRIRPVLVSVDGPPKEKKSKAQNGDNGKNEKKKIADPANASADLTARAFDIAAKAASAAEGISTASAKRDGQKGPQEAAGNGGGHADHATALHQHAHHQRQAVAPSAVQLGTPQIPHSTNRIHSVELPLPADALLLKENDSTVIEKPVADCTNATQIPKGSSGPAVTCTTLTISRGGKALWRDEITGTTCSAIAGSQHMLAVGTLDGSVYLYGTSPALGWASVAAVRSHPPLILGQAIVSLQLKKDTGSRQLEMLVVTADGSFGVYRLLPDLKLCYKGSILPAMTHMILSSFGAVNNDTVLPKLARILITDSNHLLMILSLQTISLRSDDHRNRNSTPSVGVGGDLQAFVYNRSMELWMRVADSRFMLSDFYSTLPNTKTSHTGVLSKMEDAVRSGSVMSSIKPSHRGRDSYSAAMFRNGEDASGGNIVTRSHCEDRMACAAVLGSPNEFKSWLLLYIQTLAKEGHVDHLRLVVDMLLSDNGDSNSIWWLSLAPAILNLNRKDMVKTIVIPEMSKNRALQRVTNEIALQVEMG
jgi:protein HIRA/HIR1